MNPKDDDKKKDDALEDDEDIVLDDDFEDDEDNDDDDVTVDLEEEAEKQAREEKERNKAFASMRIENKKLQDQLDQVQEQLQSVAAPKQTPKEPVVDGIPKTDEEWDALADKDWKKAVDLRSNMNAQQVMAANKQAAQANEAMDKSKAKVLERHPELNDNDSEKAKIFLKILNDNPDYINHPKGPIYAMRDMEDHMETVLGYKRSDIVSAERNGAKKESERQHRIVLNKGGGKTPSGGKNTVTLTKDEAEFCKIQGLDPKEFAKTKKKLNKSGKEGVTI